MFTLRDQRLPISAKGALVDLGAGAVCVCVCTRVYSKWSS